MTLSLAPAKHKASCLRSLPGASIRTVFSPNIVIHWRFSETDCMVGRVEVSPEARKKGHGGRVVEIGASDPLCVQHNPQSALLLSVLRASVHDACQRPAPHTKRGRKARRGQRATA